MPEWIADRRLYLTGGGLEDPHARVVEHNDPDATYLLVAEGQILAAGHVKRFNLPASLYPDPEPEPTAEEPGEKQAERVEDKMAARADDKSRPGSSRRRST